MKKLFALILFCAIAAWSTAGDISTGADNSVKPSAKHKKETVYQDNAGNIYRLKHKRVNPTESGISLKKIYFICGTPKKETCSRAKNEEGVMISYRSQQTQMLFFIQNPDYQQITPGEICTIPVLCSKKIILKKNGKKSEKILYLCEMLQVVPDEPESPKK